MSTLLIEINSFKTALSAFWLQFLLKVFQFRFKFGVVDFFLVADVGLGAVRALFDQLVVLRSLILNLVEDLYIR